MRRTKFFLRKGGFWLRGVSWLIGSRANSLGNFTGLGGRNKFFHEQQAKIDGGARAAGGQKFAVGHGAFAGQNSG
jgi:hypothetical protein